MSWLSDEESSSESTVGSSAPPPKLIRKTQPIVPTATMSASLKVPSKKETTGLVPRIDNKSPVASKRLPQKSSKILLSNSTVKIASKPTSLSSSMEVNRTTVTPSPSPSSLMIRIPLPLVKQQQTATAAAPTAAVVKKTLGSGSSSLSSSDDLSESDSEAQANDVTVTPTTASVTPSNAMELVKTTILRVPHSTAPNRTVNVVTKQLPMATTAETTVTKATTISQVISKPTLTIPSQQQLLLKPLSSKNASNISQRLASIYSPTQVKAFQLGKSATSPKATGTLPFAAFTWSNRTSSSSTTVTNTTDSSSSGFTLLSPSNATKLQLPFTSLTSNQTGAFRVIAQTAPVSTTNDTAQHNVTQQ